MTPAVFGDFLDAARLHLAAATEAWDRDPAYLPAMVPPLHQMVTVMALYAEDLAGWDGIEAAARTGLDAWERPVIDLGALGIAAGCLHRSAAELGPGGPVSDAPPAARHLADAAAELAAGRDLLYTHVTSGPDGLTQDRSEWAPVVTSLPVTRALAAEIAAWSAWLAQFTGWLTGPATPQLSRRLARQFSAVSPQEEIISAGQWLRAASTALHPASGTGSGKAADAELLHAIPAAFPPPRQPPGAAAESIAGLCDGITVSAFRLRAAVHRGRNRGSQTPEFTSGGLEWMAQAAAITSQLSELALRSLATRAGQLPGLPVTQARLHGAADALTGMRAAWQQVGLRWGTLITERRLLPTLMMSEASDLLLRMGRLVWDNPQWTPARADRSPRRDPAALAPGTAAFTAVVSAAHQAADALARVADADAGAVQAAARAGRLYVPTRSLPARYDIPRAFTPAPADVVVDLRDAYQVAAEASMQAVRELDELAIATAAPSRPLALARAALARSRRGGRGTGQPGPVEQAVLQREVTDPVVLLRAAAIDNAAWDLAGRPGALADPGAQGNTGDARDAVRLAAQSFPDGPVVRQPVSPGGPGSTCRRTPSPAQDAARVTRNGQAR